MYPRLGPTEGLVYVTRQQARAMAATLTSQDRQQAGALLGVSAHTVKRHLSLAFERLGADSLPQAAWIMGWLDVPFDELDIPTVESHTLVWIRNRK